MQFTNGEQLNHNRYEIIKPIGGGGFGIAYLAQDHKKNCQVVIKTLNKLQLQTVYRNEPDFDLYFDEVLQQSFLTEIITLASFDHPHIVKIYKETFKHKGLQCMIMDYIDGETLDDCLERKGLFSEADALKVIREIGSALDYIHSKNYLHRDVKPQNILLRKADNKAILIDFGIAREVDFTKTIDLTANKTPAFAPPEQFESRERYTP
ncbi:MAG TPA: serine/threonine-protein kinase, partial [Allocoleopsis sp.]